MTRTLRGARPAQAPSASPHLLASALAGLLCLAGCSGESQTDGPGDGGQAGLAGETSQADAGAGLGGEGGAGGNPAGGAGGDSGVEAVGGESSGGAATGGAGGDGSASEGGSAGAAGAGGAGTPEPLPHITSSENVGVLTEEDFQALCDERGGTVEVMPHCGGFATAPGFSYDVTTQLLSEHTCSGANTCTGWNCAIPVD